MEVGKGFVVKSVIEDMLCFRIIKVIRPFNELISLTQLRL